MQYKKDFIRFVNCFSSIATEKILTQKDMFKIKCKDMLKIIKEYEEYEDLSNSIDLLDEDLEFINYKKKLECN